MMSRRIGGNKLFTVVSIALLATPSILVLSPQFATLGQGNNDSNTIFFVSSMVLVLVDRLISL
ncbi:MAG: hypothetical protein JRN20_08650 [Nitrososphaerota archaeon]|nr:hypothetical protein [Nitrososphaerota archaeon]